MNQQIAISRARSGIKMILIILGCTALTYLIGFSISDTNPLRNPLGFLFLVFPALAVGLATRKTILAALLGSIFGIAGAVGILVRAHHDLDWLVIALGFSFGGIICTVSGALGAWVGGRIGKTTTIKARFVMDTVVLVAFIGVILLATGITFQWLLSNHGTIECPQKILPGIEVSVPEGYKLAVVHGADRISYYITNDSPYRSDDTKHNSGLYIYLGKEGGLSRPDTGYTEEEGLLYDKNIKWYIWTIEDGDKVYYKREAVYPMSPEWQGVNIHVIIDALDTDRLSILCDVAKSLRVNDERHGSPFAGITTFYMNNNRSRGTDSVGGESN